MNTSKQDYYLTASRLVPYKKIDLIVEAFSNMPDKRLVVIGNGSEMVKIKSKAKSNIEILGYQPDSVMLEHMQNAKAFVFAAEEDFGITPVEAQACGTPVVAFGKGGSLETVRPYGVDKPTGVFFDEQSVPSLVKAINFFDTVSDKIEPQDCRENAMRFSVEIFKNNLSKYVEDKWTEFNLSKRIQY